MPSTVTHPEIVGWGADLDPANRPAVPMNHIPPRIDVPWDSPQPQKETVEILVSKEYEERPAVFGSTLPPSGLSGRIREAAFEYSENDIRHWLMLLFADRINVVEGYADDIRHGHIPNIFAERGWRAKFKFDRGRAVRDVAFLAGVTGLGVYLLRRQMRIRRSGISNRR